MKILPTILRILYLSKLYYKTTSHIIINSENNTYIKWLGTVKLYSLNNFFCEIYVYVQFSDDRTIF